MSDICGAENSLEKSIDAGLWDICIADALIAIENKKITRDIQCVIRSLKNTTRKLKFKCKVCNKGYATKKGA